MIIDLEIVTNGLLEEYTSKVDFNLSKKMTIKSEEVIPFDYFKFYSSVSSVYSSKIEGEILELDSYIKHKFLKVKYEPDYTKRADDLYKAYEFIENKKLKKKNVLKAHSILSQNLLSSSQRGIVRTNPMFVMNEEDRIEYVACDPRKVKYEWNKLFRDIKKLKKADLNIEEIFYYGAFIHLVFLKIHPLQDGNGRTARLIEKWFLTENLGKKAISIELEKNYFVKKKAYYDNLRRLGLDYEELDYSRGLNFLLMTINSLKSVKKE